MDTGYRSRLTMRVPAGWFPAEAVHAYAGDGKGRVALVASPDVDGADVNAVARAHAGRLADGVGGCDDGEFADVKGFDGRAVVVWRGTGPAGGATRTVVRAAYCVEHAWVYVASGAIDVVEHDVDAAGKALEATLLGATLPPAPAHGLFADELANRTAATRLAPTAEDWADVRAEWALDRPDIGPVVESATYTHEQLTAAAHAYGARSVAGVDLQAIDTLATDVRRAVLATAARSLLVTGVIVAGDEEPIAGARLASDAGAIGIAVANDLLIDVHVGTAKGASRHTFAGRPDDSIVVGPAAGAHELAGVAVLERFPTGQLVERVRRAAFGSTDDAVTADGGSVELDDHLVRAALAAAARRASGRRSPDDDALAAAAPAGTESLWVALGQARGTVSVRSVYRRSLGSVSGGDLQAVDCGSAGWWRLEPLASPASGPRRVRATPVSSIELHAALLDLLPGSKVIGRGEQVTATERR